MGGFASSRILEVHGERMVKRTRSIRDFESAPSEGLNAALSMGRQLGGAAEPHCAELFLLNLVMGTGGARGIISNGARAGAHVQLRDRRKRRQFRDTAQEGDSAMSGLATAEDGCTA
jgi:hypothetical protein